MSAPGDVRYARTADGIDIAHMTFGEGEHDILLAPGFVTHLDMQWDFPWFQAFAGISRHFRITTFDKRGTGLSDRSLGFGSLEERTSDISAVMDAADIEQAIIYGISESGPMACLFAAQHPDRVRALVLYGTFARIRWGPDYPIGMSVEEGETFVQRTQSQWGTGDAYGYFAQHAPDAAAARRVLARYERGACTPQMAAEVMRRNIEIDVRPFLPAIAAPTLVVHCAHDPALPAAFGRYLAESIPGARYVEVDGDFHASWRLDDNVKLGAPVRAFLADVVGSADGPAGAASERMLATVLFTDVVGSTEKAAELGDAAWKSVLDQHDAAARDAVERCGGRLVKTTGDGVLALLDGPSKAVECARILEAGVRHLGLGIRAGVHTGEVEQRGDDVGGIGVHIAARVAALAGEGEVWVSRTVKDLTAGSGLDFEPRGVHTLKGVPDSWDLFALAP